MGIHTLLSSPHLDGGRCEEAVILQQTAAPLSCAKELITGSFLSLGDST
jgi:hypothetical protein